MFGLIRFSIIFLVVYFNNAETIKDDTLSVPPIKQNLPLILVKKGSHLRLPNGVQVFKEGMRKKERIGFTYDAFFEERFYCPHENKKQQKKLEEAKKLQIQEGDTSGEKVDEYCLLKKKPTKEKPIPPCENLPQPKIMRALEINKDAATREHQHYKQITCGPSDVGKYFSFGYMICVEFGGWDKLGLLMYKITHRESPAFKKTAEVSIYYFCLNEKKSEIMYTIHTIIAPKLLFKNYLKEERAQRWNTIETDNSPHIPLMNFEEVESAFTRVEDLYMYKIQLLIPQEDFPFLLWKRPVAHYANADLIHQDLQSCWNNIHDMIRKHATEHSNYFDIYTGAFKLPEKGEVHTAVGVKIAKIWVKIIHISFLKGNQSAVAIIANNYKDEVVDELITETYKCKINLCIDFIVEKFNHVSNYIRCCKLTPEIIGLFGEEIEFNKVLEIDELIVADNVNKPSKIERATTSPPRIWT